MPTDDRPTQKQQRYLRSLAQKTGTCFTLPTTKAEASGEIKRLKQLAASPRHERRADREAVAKAERGGEARVRLSEVTGYGSSARWR